jgi:hypothetical protein
MPTTIQQVRIFVASPGDVQSEREQLAQAVRELNSVLGVERGISFELVRWETHCHPAAGRAQGVINRQIGTYDVFVGILWTRFGTPTGDALSGTAEEFELAYNSWRETGTPRILLYFCQAPHPAPKSQAELDQLSRILAFRQTIEAEQPVLYWEYSDRQHFGEVIRPHLAQVIHEMLPRTTSSATSELLRGALSAIVQLTDGQKQLFWQVSTPPEPYRIPLDFQRGSALHNDLRALRLRNLVRPQGSLVWKAGQVVQLTYFGSAVMTLWRMIFNPSEEHDASERPAKPAVVNQEQ